MTAVAAFAMLRGDTTYYLSKVCIDCSRRNRVRSFPLDMLDWTRSSIDDSPHARSAGRLFHTLYGVYSGIIIENWIHRAFGGGKKQPRNEFMRARCSISTSPIEMLLQVSGTDLSLFIPSAVRCFRSPSCGKYSSTTVQYRTIQQNDRCVRLQCAHYRMICTFLNPIILTTTFTITIPIDWPRLSPQHPPFHLYLHCML
jgi:hypothetical protein